ncbi:Uncharacterised protein [Bordetella pertussis]|nr:Uncharacterised protein [Bordetella pertussis]CFW48300.1 Uncharacterised protein [Bordetella pertussis]
MRTALSAVSTASAPLFMGSTLCAPVRRARSSYRGASWSWRKAREVSVSRCACSTIAARMRGWQCPWLTAE